MGETQPGQVQPLEDLLQTKLSPPRLPAAFAQRPRLFARLEEGLEKRLTLVTAPTGFGKTTLVSSWLKERPLPTAWVTLDEGDNDPSRFWRYTLQAIRQVNPEVGKAAFARLRVTHQPHFPALLTSLINDLAQLPAPTRLVFDEMHLLKAPEVWDTLRFFSEHIPDNLHIFGLGRMPLAWPVGLLRARGELLELQANDLRFSPEELDPFLQSVLPGPLPAELVQRLAAKTEGWAAGVRLVTLALKGKNPSSEQVIETFNGEHRFVIDYIREEVLDQQPESTRAFLLRTSILERLCGPLCDWLLERSDSTVLLEQLAAANLFVTPLDARRGQAWYRYEPLFAEATRHQAVQTLGQAEVAQLYERASQWYHRAGQLEEAIEAALKAANLDQAIQWMEQFIEQRNFGEGLILHRWRGEIPLERLRGHPRLAFDFAWAELFSADRYAPETAQVVEPLLQSAENDWRQQGDTPGTGQVQAVRSSLAWWQGQLKRGFAQARQALEHLPESELMWRGAALLSVGQEAILDGSLLEARSRLMEAQALSATVQNIHGVLAALNMLAEVDELQGELEPAAAEYQQILVEAVGGDEMLDDQSIARLGLARIAYERSDLRTAQEQAEIALELSRRRSNESVWVPASIQLACLAQARGDVLGAQAQLQALLSQIRLPPMRSQGWAALTRLALAANDLPAARGWFAMLEKQPGEGFSIEQSQKDLLKARLWLAEGQSEPALGILRRWKAIFQEQGRARSEVEVFLLEAQALASMSFPSQPEAAFQRLAAALAIGQPKGYRRTFLDEGEPLAVLLQSAIPLLRQSSLKVFATALLHSFPGTLANRQPVQAGGVLESSLLVEPLSAQELRVLRLVAAGRSNPEIAEELVVSVNTIKTQVQSIYRKLNVNSRAEARAATRELGLI